MPIDVAALVATGAVTFLRTRLSEHFESARLKQVFDDAARNAIGRCEAEFPAGTPRWNEFVSFLNTPVRVEQLVESLLEDRALPDCPGWCQPLLEDFLTQLSVALIGTTPAAQRGGFLGLSVQMGLLGERLSRQILLATSRPVVEQAGTLEPAPETSELARRALSLVGAADSGVPRKILTRAIGIADEEWGSILEEMRQYVTVDDDDYLCPLPTLPRLDPEAVEDIEVLFDAWLQEMPHLRRSPGAQRALAEVLRLGKHLTDNHPDHVASVFRATEKVAKDLGDQRLVHKAAELAISSARRSPSREVAVLGLEAQALICGRSWVWQRHGDLGRAAESAYESLELGKAIGDDLNTAFTLKCLGRLFRMRAEQSSGEDAQVLLGESIRHLRDARAGFEALRLAYDNGPEVGDCLSLEGRSELAAGRLVEAASLVALSFDYFDNPTDKDYLDACILLSDVYRASGDLAQAAKALKPGGGGGAGQAMPDGRVPAPGGWLRFQVEVPDIEAAVAKLKAAGATLRSEIISGFGGKQILVEDPSGNPVELFQPA